MYTSGEFDFDSELSAFLEESNASASTSDAPSPVPPALPESSSFVHSTTAPKKSPCAACVAARLNCFWLPDSETTCVPCGKKRVECPGPAADEWRGATSTSMALVPTQGSRRSQANRRFSDHSRNSPYRSFTPSLSRRSPSVSLVDDVARNDIAGSLLRVFQENFGFSAPGLRPSTVVRLATADGHASLIPAQTRQVSPNLVFKSRDAQAAGRLCCTVRLLWAAEVPTVQQYWVASSRSLRSMMRPPRSCQT